MSQNKEEEFLERLSKCIATCQAIHNDSRTPLSEARALVEPIRELHRCRQALRGLGRCAARRQPCHRCR